MSGLDINPYTGQSYEDEVAAQQGEEPGIVDYLFDSATAHYRGIAGAIENIAELPGDLFGGLYDIDRNLGLGSAKYLPGQLVEGVTQFLTGFIPVVGQLGKVQKLQRLGQTGRAALAGAITDFAVFDGNDPRLSNLVQEIPELANPITEFLASNEEDGEFTGRFKNVLEGFGLGLMADGFIRMVKGLRAKNTAVQLGDADAVQKAEVEIEEGAMEAMDADGSLAEGVTSATKININGKIEYRVNGETVSAEEYARATGQTVEEALEEVATEVAEDVLISGRTAIPGDGAIPAVPDRDFITQVTEEMNVTQDTSEGIARALREAVDSGENPLRKIKGVVNTALMSAQDRRALLNAMTEHFDFGKYATEETLEESFEAGQRALQSMSGSPTRTLAERAARDVAGLQGIRRNVVAYASVVDHVLGDLGDLAEAIRKGQGYQGVDGAALTAEQTAAAFHMGLKDTGALITQYGRLRQESGRLLGNFRIAARNLNGLQSTDLVESLGGMDNIRKAAEQFSENLKVNPVAAGKMAATLTKRQRWTHLITDVFYGHMLSAVRTWTTNLAGGMATAFFQPFERWLGSLGRAGHAVKVSPEALARQQRVELKALHILADQVRDIGGFIRRRGWADSSVGSSVNRAFRTRRGVLDPGSRGIAEQLDDEALEGFSRENIANIMGKEELTGSMGSAVDIYAGLLHLPGRMMQGGDELIRQAVYKSYVKSEIMEQGWERGLRGADLDDWADIEFDKMLRDGQALTEQGLREEAERLFTSKDIPDEVLREREIEKWVADQLADTEVVGRSALAEEGLRLAREAAHQTDLHRQKDRQGLQRLLVEAGSAAQRLSQAVPAFKLLVPFVRTPVNLMLYGFDRTLLPGVNPDWMDMIRYMTNRKTGFLSLDESTSRFAQQIMSDNPRVVAAAIGRYRTAVGFTTIGLTAASAGLITGQGPTDPAERKALEDTGWQSGSINIGGTYIKYERLDPFAQIFGIWADAVDLLRYDGGMTDQGDIESWVQAMTIGLTRMIENKSYLQGLTDSLKFFEDPTGTPARIGANIVGTLNPLGGQAFISSFRNVTDDHMRDVHGFMDRIRAKIPGLGSATTDPKRNVLGEAMNKRTYSAALEKAEGFAGMLFPLQINTTSSNKVNRALADLHLPLRNPSPRRFGIDLRDVKDQEGKGTQSAYDRWLELTGTTKIQGSYLRQRLEKLISSDYYKNLPAEGIGGVDEESPRKVAITRVIQVYRRAAERQLFNEFPELRAQYRKKLTTRYGMRRGMDPSEITADILFPLENR